MAAGSRSATSSGVMRDAELVADPGAGRLQAEVGRQEGRAPCAGPPCGCASRAFSISSSPTPSRPTCFRSRSRRLRCQRVLAIFAIASQFHSRGSASSGRFSSMASSTWPSALRSAWSRA